jgi:hypothetical protein
LPAAICKLKFVDKHSVNYNINNSFSDFRGKSAYTKCIDNRCSSKREVAMTSLFIFSELALCKDNNSAHQNPFRCLQTTPSKSENWPCKPSQAAQQCHVQAVNHCPQHWSILWLMVLLPELPSHCQQDFSLIILFAKGFLKFHKAFFMRKRTSLLPLFSPFELWVILALFPLWLSP